MARFESGDRQTVLNHQPTSAYPKSYIIQPIGMAEARMSIAIAIRVIAATRARDGCVVGHEARHASLKLAKHPPIPS